MQRPTAPREDQPTAMPETVMPLALVDALARWTAASARCIDMFKEQDVEDVTPRLYAEADAVLVRLAEVAAAGQDPAGVLATDLAARRALTCSCEQLLRSTPWQHLTPPAQQNLRVRASRCMGACSMDQETLAALGPLIPASSASVPM